MTNDKLPRCEEIRRANVAGFVRDRYASMTFLLHPVSHETSYFTNSKRRARIFNEMHITVVSPRIDATVGDGV